MQNRANNSLSGQTKKTEPPSMQFISKYCRVINITLSLLGIGVVLLYYYCGSSCLYLAGAVWGLDLKIWGIVYFTLLTVFILVRQRGLVCALIAAGLGAEFFLVVYQVLHQTFCPYCLILAGIIGLLFVMNLEKKRWRLTFFCLLCGVVFMTVFFRSIPLKIDDGVGNLPAFGRGKIEVRLYTDYFCGPCRQVEPAAEKILYELTSKDRIKLIFIDMPIHSHTPMYAAYYLALSKREREFGQILRIREVLFRAAENNIKNRVDLENYLQKKGFQTGNIDSKSGTAASNRYIKDDDVEGTPTLVMVEGQKKTIYVGRVEVLKGLQTLK
jgi:thiol:disulfide interchange protein DsbA